MAAICVQNVDVQCVLQFTLIHAAGCVLHRRTSRVIHRLKLFFVTTCTFAREKNLNSPRHDEKASDSVAFVTQLRLRLETAKREKFAGKKAEGGATQEERSLNLRP